MRRALLLLAVVVLVLVGPELVQRDESPTLMQRVPTAVGDGGEAHTGRGCFGMLQPWIRRPRHGCERIRERRGGVETRLGTVEIAQR